MLFLLVLPVISCVALLWRYLQIYAPSNVLARKVRLAPPRWRTAMALAALTTALLVAMRATAQAVECGAPAWLNLIVLVLAWDAIKIGLVGIVAMLRSIGASTITLVRAARSVSWAGRRA